MERTVCLLLVALSVALAGCGGAVDGEPAPAPPASPASEAHPEPASPAPHNEALSPIMELDDYVAVDPTGVPDRLWHGHIVCPRRAPITCACDFDHGRVYDVYVSQRTCQCEAFARVAGTLHTHALCER